jgi:peptide/nickel transport system ATP-binding protein
MNALEVQGLRVRFGRRSNAVTAVDGVDLQIPLGGTLGLVGESGCGKSTVARALVGLVPITSGTLTLAGKPVAAGRALNASWYRRQVQMVFQDPYSSLNPRMTVGDALREAIRIGSDASAGKAERHAEAERLLELVGLGKSALDRYPHQFSGGQLQRIAIARAVAVRPRVLIADEITSALDVSVQSTVLQVLKDLQRSLGLSVLFISHDLAVVRLVSDSVAVMYLGRIVERAETDALFSAPSHPYTDALIGGVPTLGGVARRAPLAGDLPDPRRPPSGCRFHTRCPIGPRYVEDRTICVDVDPPSTETEPGHHAACHFAQSVAAPRSPESVERMSSTERPEPLPTQFQSEQSTPTT